MKPACVPWRVVSMAHDELAEAIDAVVQVLPGGTKGASPFLGFDDGFAEIFLGAKTSENVS